jgi:long-subunit fatty acid transport protein
MKRSFLIMLALTGISTSILAGGIVTNTNQSAAYVRMLARDASTGIDAVYFNPAGLTLLKEGFHISISNQTIWQNRKITSDYSFLNNKEYEGKVFAPVFPSVYAAYKTGKVVFSAGFNPVGGGGGAEYKTGLPSFEYGISDLVPALNAKGVPVTAYSTDIYFKGQSVYWGIQLGVTTELSDNVSLFGGLRVNLAKTTYEGHLRNTTIYSNLPAFNGATSIGASDFFAGAELKYTQYATQFGAYPAGMVMPDTIAQKAQLPVGTTFGQATAIFTQAAGEAKARKTLLADQEADVTQKGSSVTPIFGMNFSLLDKKLNIGFKYELPTPMLVKNDTKKDVIVGFTPTGTPVTQFPNELEFHNDIPTLFSLGASYKFSDKFSAALGFHDYFDKSSNYGKTNMSGEFVTNEDIIDKNYWELALGLEYTITKKLLVSAGVLRAQSGVTEDYQSDLSYSLSSNTGGFGFAYNINDNIQVNLGALYTMYEKAERSFPHVLGDQTFTIKESLEKDNLVISVGVDMSFGK